MIECIKGYIVIITKSSEKVLNRCFWVDIDRKWRKMSRIPLFGQRMVNKSGGKNFLEDFIMVYIELKTERCFYRDLHRNECKKFWIIFLSGKVCVWGRNALFMWPIYLHIGPQQRIAWKKKKKKLKSFMYLVEILNVKCEHFFNELWYKVKLKTKNQKCFSSYKCLVFTIF